MGVCPSPGILFFRAVESSHASTAASAYFASIEGITSSPYRPRCGSPRGLDQHGDGNRSDFGESRRSARLTDASRWNIGVVNR
jgi:hypothetical protein